MIKKYLADKYTSKNDYDDMFPKIISLIRKRTSMNDDDFLLLLCGATGTGKSMLGLHGIELYASQTAEIKYIALNRGDFATSLKDASEKEGLRYVMNDEANINKRDSLTNYNKKVIDLYFSIRGLNIFHIWCNPSADVIDKEFIEEKINGLIFIKSKDKTRPRIYFYFRKKELLKIWDKFGNLKLKTLSKCTNKYGYYCGWFKDYNGFLKEQYLIKKTNRMKEKIDSFYNEFGKTNDMIESPQLCKIMGLTRGTIKNYQDEALKEGLIEDGVDVVLLLNGRTAYSKKSIEIFKQKAKERKKKEGFALEKGVFDDSKRAVSIYTHEEE